MENFSVKMMGIFSGQKVVQSHLLNLLGLHICRILVARFFYSLRTMLLFSKLTEEQKILRKDGIIMIKNFLPNDKFESLKNEFENAKNFDGTDSETIDGDSIWSRRKFNRVQYANLPNTKTLLSNLRLLNLINSAEARKVTVNAVWFDEVNYPDKKVKDKHKAAMAELWHLDVFYNSHKVFYFMYDVMDEHGPLNFAPESHRLSLKRLWFEYKKSVEVVKTESDSFQANERERSFLGLKNIKAIVPANTLVIMNGCAFHRRGDAIVGSKRSNIFLQFRYNPFSLKIQMLNSRKKNEQTRITQK